MSEQVELRAINEQLLLLRALIWSILKPEQSRESIAEELRAHLVKFRQEIVPPRATLDLPERCDGVQENRCGLQDPDAQVDLSTFGSEGKWQCVGCGERERYKGIN